MDQAFEMAPDAMAILDDERLVVAVNAAACALFGIEREELVGRRIDESIPGDRRPEIEPLWQQLLDEGTLRGKFQVVRPDGGVRDVEYAASARVAPRRHLALIRDVTEERSARRRDAEAKRRLNEAQALAAIGSWEWRIADGWVYWSPQLREVWGLDEAQPDPDYEEFLATLDPEDRPGFLRAVDRAVETGERFRRRFRIRRPDGSVRTVESHAEVQLGESGRPERFVGAAQDITDRARAETELRAAAGRQAALADLGRRVIAGADPPTLMEQAVRLVARELGCEIAEVLELEAGGETLVLRAEVGLDAGLVGATRVPADDSHAGFALRGSGPVTVGDYETEARFRPAPLLTDSGARSGVSVVIEGNEGAFGILGAHARRKRDFGGEDESFLHLLAAAMTRARGEELERELARTRRLDAIGELAGGVAHDFNNLLAVILNYADFLVQELEGERRSDAEEIRDAAGRAAELTEQLLMFGRREVGDSGLADLAATVGATRSILDRTLGEHIELVTRVEPGLEPVDVGSAQLEQVIINLVANARDAMPEGGRLEVSIERADPPPAMSGTGGGVARLRVADSGTGMSPEARAQALEPFFTTKGPGRGTGLGLSSVYGVVKGAGGEIEIETALGEGTTVSVYLPLSQPPIEEPLVGRGSSVPLGSGELVLLVEDDDRLRALIERMLRGGGYSVLSARDGAHAEQVIASSHEPIALLLTDVVMPRRSGPSLAQLCRERYPDTRILLMSGYSAPAARGRSEAGAEYPFLQKPFDGKALLRAVSRSLHPSPGDGGEAPPIGAGPGDG